LPSSSDFTDGNAGGGSGGFPEFESSAPATSNSRPSNDFVSSFERDPPKQQKQATVAIDDDEDDDDAPGGGSGGNDAVQQFQSQYPDLDLYPAQTSQPQQSQNGYSSEPAYSQPAYTSAPTPAEPESDAIRAWREKQQEEIQRRDEASAARKEEIIRKAEKAIDDFYANYNQKKEKQIAQNKENEAAFVQARDDALGKGTTWERIADMIELQDSRSKTAAKGTRDLSRMKEVLLSLKREGDTAPNAMGY